MRSSADTDGIDFGFLTGDMIEGGMIKATRNSESGKKCKHVSRHL